MALFFILTVLSSIYIVLPIAWSAFTMGSIVYASFLSPIVSYSSCPLLSLLLINLLIIYFTFNLFSTGTVLMGVMMLVPLHKWVPSRLTSLQSSPFLCLGILYPLSSLLFFCFHLVYSFSFCFSFRPLSLFDYQRLRIHVLVEVKLFQHVPDHSSYDPLNNYAPVTPSTPSTPPSAYP